MQRFTVRLLLALALAAAFNPAARALAVERPVVTASTSMIGCMLELLAPGGIEVQTLIPPASCPGTYDLRPGDASRLARSVLIVRHDYQAYLDSRFREQNPAMHLAVLETPGHLLVPQNFRRALEQLKGILAQTFPSLDSSLEANYAAALTMIDSADTRAHNRLEQSGIAGRIALCSDKQVGFALWAGVKSAGTFTNSPEELSALNLGRIIKAGREGGAAFVVGNLQSGGEKVARAVAAQTGLPVCILSNFPGTNARNGDWPSLLADNLELLIQAAGGDSQP